MRFNMKKIFGLILLLGFSLISCGNAFHTKSLKRDTVDVTLQIPAEILSTLSNRQAAGASSNSLEVSLFVNDEEPIIKVIDFSNKATVSFSDISIGSTVKAKANLKYDGKEYSGESVPVVVTESGAQLVLVLKQKKSSGSTTHTKTISIYVDNIFLESFPLEEGGTIEMMMEELSYENFTETQDYTIDGNKIILTDSGLEKFMTMVSDEEGQQSEPMEILLVYDNRMFGGLSHTGREEFMELLRSSGYVVGTDYEFAHNGMILKIYNSQLFQAYANFLSGDPNGYNPNEVFLQEESGEIEINQSKLIFTHFDDHEVNHVRYMCTISLDDILNEKHLSNGDTVAFVLKTSDQQTSDIFDQNSVSQFYYQLQEEDWQEDFEEDTEGLFRNNNCINFDIRSNGQYTFVMPLNLIEGPEDYCELQFFFDCPKGTEAASFELNCSINYYIFPATQRAFVFGVGKNWDKDPNTNPDSPDYRYEINIPLRDSYNRPLDLSGGDTVSVYLQGTIRGFSNSSFMDLSTETIFNTELYDNANYENSSFHALSKDEISEGVPNTGNVKQLSIGTDGELENSGQFVFSQIQEPYTDEDNDEFENDFRFQCHTICTNPEVLLVITNYYCGNVVTPGN